MNSTHTKSVWSLSVTTGWKTSVRPSIPSRQHESSELANTRPTLIKTKINVDATQLHYLHFLSANIKIPTNKLPETAQTADVY